MSKKRPKGRRVKEARRPRLRSVPTLDEGPRGREPENQELIRTFRKVLRSDHPADLLGAVSGVMSATDPRGRGPFSGDEPQVELDELLDSFLGVDIAETTAVLAVIRSFVDELAVARIGKELGRRRQPMPAWMKSLDDVEITRVVEMTEVLGDGDGDGDDYIIEATFPTGEKLAVCPTVARSRSGPRGPTPSSSRCAPSSSRRRTAAISTTPTSVPCSSR